MSGEHRKKKRAYLNDFHKNDEGKYEYRGNMYTCEGGSQALARARRQMWAIYAVLIVCLIACGCIPSPQLGKTIYVILPYALGLMGAISLGWALCRLSCAGDALKEYIYEVTVKKLPHRAIATIVLNIAAILGLVVLGITRRNQVKLWHMLLFAALELAAVIGAVIIHKIAGRLRWNVKTGAKNPESGQ